MKDIRQGYDEHRELKKIYVKTGRREMDNNESKLSLPCSDIAEMMAILVIVAHTEYLSTSSLEPGARAGLKCEIIVLMQLY